jgi:hypothetical protein
MGESGREADTGQVQRPSDGDLRRRIAEHYMEIHRWWFETSGTGKAPLPRCCCPYSKFTPEGLSALL